jgi:hypothetical protein
MQNVSAALHIAVKQYWVFGVGFVGEGHSGAMSSSLSRMEIRRDAVLSKSYGCG